LGEVVARKALKRRRGFREERQREMKISASRSSKVDVFRLDPLSRGHFLRYSRTLPGRIERFPWEPKAPHLNKSMSGPTVEKLSTS